MENMRNKVYGMKRNWMVFQGWTVLAQGRIV